MQCHLPRLYASTSLARLPSLLFMVFFSIAHLNCDEIDISTPMLQPWVSASPEFATYLSNGIAAGRLGKPVDVAGAVAWLASGAESAYVTGIVLPVDGGFTAR